jgi:nitrate/nitrite transporter NarK
MISSQRSGVSRQKSNLARRLTADCLRSGGLISNAATVSASERPALFSPLFFLLCSFTFTTFLSAFLLFPTVPFRILSLGGTKVQAGLFLGFITYASAFSAPLGGAVADRLGKRSILIASSWVILLFSAAYGIVASQG